MIQHLGVIVITYMAETDSGRAKRADAVTEMLQQQIDQRNRVSAAVRPGRSLQNNLWRLYGGTQESTKQASNGTGSRRQK